MCSLVDSDGRTDIKMKKTVLKIEKSGVSRIIKILSSYGKEAKLAFSCEQGESDKVKVTMVVTDLTGGIQTVRKFICAGSCEGKVSFSVDLEKLALKLKASLDYDEVLEIGVSDKEATVSMGKKVSSSLPLLQREEGDKFLPMGAAEVLAKIAVPCDAFAKLLAKATLFDSSVPGHDCCVMKFVQQSGQADDTTHKSMGNVVLYSGNGVTYCVADRVAQEVEGEKEGEKETVQNAVSFKAQYSLAELKKYLAKNADAFKTSEGTMEPSNLLADGMFLCLSQQASGKILKMLDGEGVLQMILTVNYLFIQQGNLLLTYRLPSPATWHRIIERFKNSLDSDAGVSMDAVELGRAYQWVCTEGRQRVELTLGSDALKLSVGGAETECSVSANSTSVTTGVDSKQLSEVFKLLGRTGQISLLFAEMQQGADVKMPCFTDEAGGTSCFIIPCVKEEEEEEEEDSSSEE